MTIYEKLMNIQQELKAPKGQKNSYGNYNYRSAEDILEAVKPLLAKNKCVLIVGDTLINEGSRYYIQATACLCDTETGETVSNNAYAREAEVKKGMDDSQITGTASSYARKYAMNGLFCIDDTKDADTDEYRKQNDKQNNKKQEKPLQPVSNEELNAFKQLCADSKKDYKDVWTKTGDPNDMSKDHLDAAIQYVFAS